MITKSLCRFFLTIIYQILFFPSIKNIETEWEMKKLLRNLHPNREGNKKQIADAVCFLLAPPAGLEPATRCVWLE
jgi:hypothetical protein